MTEKTVEYGRSNITPAADKMYGVLDKQHYN
jgi:hypothetical protein